MSIQDDLNRIREELNALDEKTKNEIGRVREQHLLIQEEIARIREGVIPFLKELSEGQSEEYWKETIREFQKHPEFNQAQVRLSSIGLRAAELLGRNYNE
jgi:hypothetical protein